MACLRDCCAENLRRQVDSAGPRSWRATCWRTCELDSGSRLGHFGARRRVCVSWSYGMRSALKLGLAAAAAFFIPEIANALVRIKIDLSSHTMQLHESASQ